MSFRVDTPVSHILSYLDVFRDDITTLDGRPVPPVTAPLLSSVLSKGGDDGGVRVSVELLLVQYAVLYSEGANIPHLEFV